MTNITPTVGRMILFHPPSNSAQPKSAEDLPLSAAAKPAV
jgi:hypothetical protein